MEGPQDNFSVIRRDLPFFFFGFSATGGGGPFVPGRDSRSDEPGTPAGSSLPVFAGGGGAGRERGLSSRRPARRGESSGERMGEYNHRATCYSGASLNRHS